MTWLISEFATASARIGARHRDFLAQAGVLRVDAAHTSDTGWRMVGGCLEPVPAEPQTYPARRLVGWSQVWADAGADGLSGAFEPVSDGPQPPGTEIVKAFVVPVGASDPDTGMWAEVWDLVAFNLAQPGRWWLRSGLADLLGEDHVEACAESGAPVQLVATPLDWLRAGGDAACVLDWSRVDPRDVFARCRRVEPASPDVGRLLKTRLRQLARTPFVIGEPGALTGGAPAETVHA
ncbi:hypothetical protein [Azospirillum thermophilum]|uniref:hypothetical protein n=1 Tax=Azospirillum thermophilum TaxID=2202148 RepID=UPI0011B5BFA0|nr:hypothetical protein [Azospirillum thermophilum]